MTVPGLPGPGPPDRLVAGILSGDQSALVAVEQTYRVILRKIARSQFHFSDHDSQDLAQDLVVALIEDDYRLLRSYRGEASLATWLARIARRRCLDRVRRASTRHMLGSSGAAHPSTSSAQIEDRLAVRQALSQLKPRDRVLVRYFFFEGRSCKEIANALHLQENTVASCLFRAKGRLRGLLLGNDSKS